MMAASDLLSHGMVERIGWTLLHFVWQGAAVAIVSAAVLAVLRRQSAQARYAAACGALLAMVALPAATLWTVSGEAKGLVGNEDNLAPLLVGAREMSGAPTSPLSASPPRADGPATFALPIGPSAAETAWSRLSRQRLSDLLGPLLPWVVSAWLMGTLVLSARLLCGWAQGRRLARQDVRPAPDACRPMLARLSRRLRISRPVQLLQSGLAQVPTVIGWLRPVVLLPGSALTGLTPPQLEAILAHELAHIRRHDYLVNLLQGVVEVLLFYHPGVWWVSQRIRVEREQCCDDVAVGLCGDAVVYARALTELEQGRGDPPQLALAATDGRLLTRIRRLVGCRWEGPASSSSPAGMVALAVAAVCLVWLLVGTAALPQEVAAGVVERAGVKVLCEQGANEAYVEPITDVVSTAKEAIEALSPGLAKEQILVHIHPAPGYYESTVTDRRDTIHVNLGEKGLGEFFRPDAGPVGVLCQAVAELYNPQRLPGLDRYLTHRCLVPAILDELGPDPLPVGAVRAAAEDGAAMLELMADPAYAPVHPDFAAVAALVAIEDEIELEGLSALITSIPDGAKDPFASLREAAVAKEPTLAEAFQTYDEATQLELEEDGSCLIASFEENEIVSRAWQPLAALDDPLPLIPSFEFEMSQSDEWATDGELCLRLHADKPRRWSNVRLSDPDWKFKDWTQFSAFEMDVMVEGEERQDLNVWLFDDVGLGHGIVIILGQMIQPGQPCHIRFPLNRTSLSGGRSDHTGYFEPPFRASEVACLSVMLRSPTRPVTLYLDNLRLIPRATPDEIGQRLTQ